MTAKVTERVDTLNGETGKILHQRIFLSTRSAANSNHLSAKKTDQRCVIVAP
jgi:hypothetical protein